MRWWEDPKRAPRHPRSVSRGIGIGSAADDTGRPKAPQAPPPPASAPSKEPPPPTFVSEHDRQLWEEQQRRYAYSRQWVRLTGDEPLAVISDEKLQTIVAAQPIDQSSVSADLAEAQLGVADRCVICGRPVIGAYVRRDDRGRPRHRRCP